MADKVLSCQFIIGITTAVLSIVVAMCILHLRPYQGTREARCSGGGECKYFILLLDLCRTRCEIVSFSFVVFLLPPLILPSSFVVVLVVVFLSLSFNCEFVDHLPSPSPPSFPCHFVIEARVKTRPLIIPTAYYFCFPIICFSLSFSLHFSLSSRFSDYLYKFRHACFVGLSAC